MPNAPLEAILPSEGNSCCARRPRAAFTPATNASATPGAGPVTAQCAPLLMSLIITASGSPPPGRSEEHTSELQSLMRISYAVFCLKQKKQTKQHLQIHTATKPNKS